MDRTDSGLCVVSQGNAVRTAKYSLATFVPLVSYLQTFSIHVACLRPWFFATLALTSMHPNRQTHAGALGAVPPRREHLLPLYRNHLLHAD